MWCGAGAFERIESFGFMPSYLIFVISKSKEPWVIAIYYFVEATKKGDIAFVFFCLKKADVLFNLLKSKAGKALPELAEGFQGFADEAGKLRSRQPIFVFATPRV